MLPRIPGGAMQIVEVDAANCRRRPGRHHGDTVPVPGVPAAGAANAIYLASSEQIEGVTGRYFVNRKPKTSNKASYHCGAAARLWQVSAALVGLPAVPGT